MEPLLIDFGIASLSSSNDELNTIGRGTVQYKAPELFDIYSVSDESDELTLEQAAAKHTGASDTWAFGMTVYVQIQIHLITATSLIKIAGTIVTRAPIHWE